jgi:hypothetical protein
MALVTQERAREILLRHTTREGGGLPRIDADVKDLLETVEKVSKTLEEVLDGWWALAPGDAERSYAYELGRALLRELQEPPAPVLRPYAYCPKCGWHYIFDGRIVGVGEALVVSALVEEAQALHRKHGSMVRIAFRPDTAGHE